jgi:quinol monooxygenase YgiN
MGCETGETLRQSGAKGPAAVVITTIRAETLPGKLKELQQALGALLGPTRESEGCTDCRVYEEMESRGTLSMITAWTSETDFEHFRASHTGQVLLGAFQALCREVHLTLSRVSSREQIEVTKSGSGR